MPAPSVMDARTFLTMTRLGVFNGRKSLEELDTMLKNCVALDSKTADQRIALMAGVMGECQKWLQVKALKSAAAGGEAENTAKRRGAVEMLLHQAQKRFAYERFEQKKAKARIMGARRPVGKTLQSGYMPERLQFKAERDKLRTTGKYDPGITISPIGGSYAHEMHDLAKKGQLSVAARPGAFAEFTVADYEAYKATGDSFTQSPFVHYMRKEERLGNMLVVQDGLLTHKGGKYTSGIQTNIYVMDLYGNLFFQKATEAGRMVGKETSQFNHSSLNAGAEVICAGVIVAESGVLMSISNESGHYAPTHLNLQECIRYLVADGLNISSASVSILTASAESPFGPWRAELFMANPDACLCQPPEVRTRSGALIGNARDRAVAHTQR